MWWSTISYIISWVSKYSRNWKGSMVKHNEWTSLIELANNEEIGKVDWSEINGSFKRSSTRKTNIEIRILFQQFVCTVAIWQVIQWIKHDGYLDVCQLWIQNFKIVGLQWCTLRLLINKKGFILKKKEIWRYFYKYYSICFILYRCLVILEVEKMHISAETTEWCYNNAYQKLNQLNTFSAILFLLTNWMLKKKISCFKH